MQIPKNIEIKDATGKRVAFLSPKSDGLKDCYPDIRLNGESTLEFSLPATSDKIEELTPECQIWANGKVYHLLKDDAVDFVRGDNNKLWAKFMAVERWSELDTSYVEPSISNDPTAKPAADLAVIIVGGGNNLSHGRYATGTAGHALYAILKGSGWSLGVVDIIGIRDLEMEKVSRLELIKKIQNIWGGYLIWDSINRVVHLRSERLWQNYTGFQVRYRKNLKHITRTQSNRLVTKLYAFGHQDLDIASVNGGKKYVTNHNYTSRVYVGIYRNQDIHDALELKEKALDELELISRPRHLYQVKLVDLRTLPEYSHEDFTLGDMVDIIDPSIAPDSPRPRIIGHKFNLFKPWDCELEIGDPEERLIEKLKASFDTTTLIDNTFDSSGRIPGGKLVDMSITYKQLGIASVTTQAIANLAVDVEKLADLSVTVSKIVDGSITMPKLGDAAVSADKIKDKAVTGGKIDNLAIDTAHIQTGAIVNAHIVNAAIDSAKIADAAITSAKIKDAAIGSAAIGAAAIGTAHIANAAILTAHIGDAQIVSAKIDKLAVNSAHIQDLAVTTFKIGNTAITERTLQNLAVTTDKIGNMAITSGKIDNLAVTNAKIGNAAITNAKIGDLAVTNAKIANLAVTTAKIDDLAVTNAKIQNLKADKITAGTISATVSLTAAIITSQSDINVNRDITVGDHIYMNATTFGGGIIWGNRAEIYIDPAMRALHLQANGGIYANGIRIDDEDGGDDIIRSYHSGNRFYADLDGDRLAIRDSRGGFVGYAKLT